MKWSVDKVVIRLANLFSKLAENKSEKSYLFEACHKWWYMAMIGYVLLVTFFYLFSCSVLSQLARHCQKTAVSRKFRVTKQLHYELRCKHFVTLLYTAVDKVTDVWWVFESIESSSRYNEVLQQTNFQSVTKFSLSIRLQFPLLSSINSGKYPQMIFTWQQPHLENCSWFSQENRKSRRRKIERKLKIDVRVSPWMVYDATLHCNGRHRIDRSFVL